MDYISIGGVKIEKNAALAPMASVADRAYRALCKENGASYMVSEMISAKGLCYSDRKTEELCTVLDSERPYALQLFGDDPQFIAEAAKRLMEYRPDIIDINMGCPVPKVAGNGAGSALMKNTKLAAEIVRAAVNAVPVPITAKIRKGWDEEHVNAVEFAKALEQAGAAAYEKSDVSRQSRLGNYTRCKGSGENSRNRQRRRDKSGHCGGSIPRNRLRSRYDRQGQLRQTLAFRTDTALFGNGGNAARTVP